MSIPLLDDRAKLPLLLAFRNLLALANKNASVKFVENTCCKLSTSRRDRRRNWLQEREISAETFISIKRMCEKRCKDKGFSQFACATQSKGR